MLTKCLDHQGD